MTIKVGDTLPEATFYMMGENGPAAKTVSDLAKGRKIVMFGLPAAFSGTCTSAHVPSFMRTSAGFAEKGVDEIFCVAVNDAFTMAAWDKDMGAGAGGVTFLGDPKAEFTKAIGMEFDFPAAGLFDRSKRYSLVVEDGVVTHLKEEEQGGVCELTAGEILLEEL